MNDVCFVIHVKFLEINKKRILLILLKEKSGIFAITLQQNTYFYD